MTKRLVAGVFLLVVGIIMGAMISGDYYIGMKDFCVYIPYAYVETDLGIRPAYRGADDCEIIVNDAIKKDLRHNKRRLQGLDKGPQG